MPAGNPQCWEAFNSSAPASQQFCGLFSHPLDAIQQPFISYFGIWFLPIVWTVWLVVLWQKSQSPMMVAVVGLLLAASIPALNAKAVGVGMLLIVAAVGMTMYQLYQQRVNYPST